jgi:CheY-like chemotaxis protein
MSPTPPARILVVDDDPEICDLLACFLIGEGYAVSVAPDGHIALELAVEQPPDLVLTDVGLPRISGPTLYALLRSRGFHGPVVLMTGDRRHAAALATHPAPVVRKPVDLLALLVTIHRALASGPRLG